MATRLRVSEFSGRAWKTPTMVSHTFSPGSTAYREHEMVTVARLSQRDHTQRSTAIAGGGWLAIIEIRPDNDVTDKVADTVSLKHVHAETG